MIYGFAQQSEGHVRIYSEVGQGTTVKLYLPRYPRRDARRRGCAAAGEAQLRRTGETVLVVEDEQVVRALIVDVLHELGYRALEAEDGPSGLAILQSRTSGRPAGHRHRPARPERPPAGRRRAPAAAAT